MSQVAIVYHSGYGHTEVVARQVAAGVTEAGGDPVLLQVEQADQDFAPLLAAITAADAVVFGSPTYMGSYSAPMKAFIDATSAVWQTAGWTDKIAAGFTNSLSYSGDKLSTLTSLAILAAQHRMIWVGQAEAPAGIAGTPTPDAINRIGSHLGLMTQSDNLPPDQAPPAGDRATARLFGQRVARAADRWHGRALATGA